ncbi:MAG: multicopper oxidase family protein [Myxococcota bacterium]
MRLPVLVLLLACNPAAPSKDEPGGTDAGDTGTLPAPEACGYTAAEDLDPADDVVEVDLRASSYAWDPGTGVPLEAGLAFDEQVPGPLLEATRGDTLRVNFTNDTDLELTIHWHGLRVSPEMDGVMQMMDPVQPGETFTYELALQDSGYYWYHPHMSGDTVLERGLYGNIIVREPGEGRADCELPLVLDDVLLDEDTWQIEPPDTDMMQLMGRLGNKLLANGRTDRRIAVTKGQTLLLRLVNSANARFWDLRLEGHTMKVVATDGGFVAEPWEVDHLLLVPGERYVVAVEATGEPGEEYRLLNARFQLHDEHESDMVEVDPMGDGENPVLSLVYGDGSVEGTPWVQPTPDVPAWDRAADAFGHQWVLQEDMMGGTVTLDGETWPDVPMVSVAGNTDTTFEVFNDSEMHHPFHIHGNRFQIVAIDGVAPTTPVGWKDTWDVAPQSTVTVVSALDNPGEWMVHCHILEHAEDGMAGLMTVEP